MNIQVLLIVLQSTKEYVTDRIFEHLGIGYLTSALRQAGYTVKIIDQNITKIPLQQIISKTLELKPTLIGLSCYQDSYSALTDFVKTVKEQLPTTHISLGGVFATNTYTYILSELRELDSLVLGEGENTFVELAESIFSAQDWTKHPHITFANDPLWEQKYPKYEESLDSLIEPARDTLPAVLQQGMSPLILSSRGCYGRCSYCSITTNTRNRRCRNINSVLDEMERLHYDYQVKHIQIVDDTFVGGSHQDSLRIEEFARELINRKLDLQFTVECRSNEVKVDLMKLLKQAGLRSVFLGVESGYQPTLNLFQKDLTVKDNEQAIQILQNLGINYTVGFIMFHPYTTLAEVEANINFLFKTDQRNLLYSLKNMLQVFPNTPIATKLKKDAKLTGPWHGYTYSFSNQDVLQLYDYIITFYLKVLPDIERLGVRFRERSDPDRSKKMAALNGEICTLFIETILTYIKEPSPQLLKDRTQELLNLKLEVTKFV